MSAYCILQKLKDECEDWKSKTRVLSQTEKENYLHPELAAHISQLENVETNVDGEIRRLSKLHQDWINLERETEDVKIRVQNLDLGPTVNIQFEKNFDSENLQHQLTNLKVSLLRSRNL